jgi:hypothetical protein
MTAKDIINTAALLANIMPSGDSLNTEEYVDCLAKLNSMLVAWNTEQIMIFTIVNYTHALSASTQSYTIGAGANFDTPRPLKIQTANVIQPSGTSDKLDIISSKDWAAIDEKSLTGVRPKVIYDDYNYPLSTLYVWPKPSGTPTLDLWMWVQLSTFPLLTTPFDMPPGYLEAVTYNLALHFCIMFGKPLSPDLRAQAQAQKAKIAGLNLSNQAAMESPPQAPAPPQQ